MRILVTGASGFVGGELVGHLIRQGHDVVTLSRNAAAGTPACPHISADLSVPGIHQYILSAATPCPVIVHAAAALAKDHYTPVVSLVNGLGTQEILKVATSWKSDQVIFLSSAPLIGQPRQHPITEDHPVCPLTAYHASKFYGECLVQLVAQDGVTGTSLRLTAPVGPRMPSNRILTVFLDRARTGQPLLLAGQGSRSQDYVDVRDVAQAVEKSMHHRAGGIFNIGSGRVLSNRELAELCIRMTRSRSTVTYSGKPDVEEGVIWDVAIDRARKAFDYQPRFTMEDTLRDWLKDYADRPV